MRSCFCAFAACFMFATAARVSAGTWVESGDADGLEGEPIALLSPHPIGRLEFDGVFVAEDGRLGERDRGFGVAMRTLDLFRPSVGAAAVGMAQAALDAAVAYAGKREAFGKPLRELQAVGHLLAEMATRTHAARLTVHAAATAYDTGGSRITELAAMAKLFATEAAQFVVDSAIQVHGGAGICDDLPLAMMYAHLRTLRLADGPDEIHKRTIARHELRRWQPAFTG